MVKARQTLEYMVKCLCERYDILETSLLEMIDALYSAGKISKTTCEHYHKIRTIGNKAIHEGDNSAYNANQAHHLLSQEVYTFANDYNDTQIHPDFPKCSSNLRFFPPSREQPSFLCRLWKWKTCRHTFRQLRGTPSARLCRRSIF